MPLELTRRQFLRSAGGITFLALTPIGRGLFAATPDASILPIFTGLPYIQPGDSSLLVEGNESVTVAWQTVAEAAVYRFEFGMGDSWERTAAIERRQRPSAEGDRFNYAARLTGLPLGAKIHYRLIGNGRTVVEGHFTTRQPRGRPVRFVALGDNACRAVGNRNVAYQSYLTHPDFVVNTGDSVYDRGRDSEYSKYFFPVFNSDKAEQGVGAPLLRSVPYYSVLGNHDVVDLDPETHERVVDFRLEDDALGYYTNMHLPLNGLSKPSQPTTIEGRVDQMAVFMECAGGRFPRMANYSFDYGDAHFLCLDSNVYVNPLDASLQKWIEADLQSTHALWKFVVFHHPPFNVGTNHYREQQMRVLSPTWERFGIDMVLGGHEHTYQRTKPLRFAPGDTSKAAQTSHADRRVPGTFAIDGTFDGNKSTRPDGVIYVTTGAGGQMLYCPTFNNNPPAWLHPDDNNAPYVDRFISDRHSFSLFDLDGPVLTMRQIDENGAEIDHLTVTKA